MQCTDFERVYNVLFQQFNLLHFLFYMLAFLSQLNTSLILD